tara:strand:+ start:60 stop:461 length:402 start_codon:yes stop_codon:yes gene_type:complete
MTSFIQSYKKLGSSEPKPASFNHAMWLLLVSGLIAHSSACCIVTLSFAVAWALVGLLIFPIVLYGTYKTLRNILIVDAYLSITILSLSAFNHILGLFEMGILIGQTIFAVYLACLTNQQILERERLGILEESL